MTLKQKFRYWVSYFCKLNLRDNGLGIKNDGHFKTGTYEITHPLNTRSEVQNFVDFLQKKEGDMWEVILLGFSLMYIIGEKNE